MLLRASRLREAASALRLAELREGVWMRPSNLDWGARDDLAVIGEQCTWMTATPDDPVAIAASLWDLDGWAADAKALIARMKRGRGASIATTSTPSPRAS